MGAAIIGLIGAGVSAASQAGVFGGSGTAGTQRNLANEKTQNFYTDWSLANPILNAERAYRPQYGALDTDLLTRALLGGGASTYNETVALTPQELVDEFNKRFQANPGKYPGLRRLGYNTGDFGLAMNAIGSQTKVVPHQIPAQSGLLDIFERAQPRISAIGRQAALYDSNTRYAVGKQVLGARDAADPQAAALLSTLTNQAGSDLAAGTQLSPGELREAQQYVRQGQAARGVGYGPADIFTEAMTLGDKGRQLQDQRRGFAENVYNMRLDPFMRVLLGQGGDSLQSTGTFLGAASSLSQGAGPRLFNSNDPYGDLGNSQMKYAGNVNAQNQKNAWMGGMLSSLGSLANSYFTNRSAPPGYATPNYNNASAWNLGGYSGAGAH